MLRWLSVIIWMVLIFIGSSIPADAIPAGPKEYSLLIHFLEYFILTLLLLWAVNGGFHRAVSPRVMLAAAATALFYAFTDEIHQLYVPGRVSDLLDLFVDSVGVAVACMLVPLIVHICEKQIRKTK